jgi:hypothetical protein
MEIRALALCAFWASPLFSQEGGVPVEFCAEGGRFCSEDGLEIVFESGVSTYNGPLEPGAEIPIQVVIEAKSAEIQGYSWAVKHDPEHLALIPESVTTDGTIIDPGHPDTAVSEASFNATRAVPGGFMSAVVLAYYEERYLPLGRSVICRAAYRVESPAPCTVIRFVHGQLGAPGSPPVALVVTVGGRSLVPRHLRQGVLGDNSCVETCDDLTDDDSDGLADCADPDCANVWACGDEVCDDGIDNDGDSLLDCDDAGCWTVPQCIKPETCSDGIDNDRDGAADCADRDCAGTPVCPHLEVCGDGIDNDGDDLMDCADPECRWEEPCTENCDDGIDNDGDGFMDGLDRGCTGYGWVDEQGNPQFPYYVRGDADGSGRVNILDALVTVQVVLRVAPLRFACPEALNANDDGGVDLGDAVAILRYIFRDGPAPAAPFPDCGSHFTMGCTEPSPGC